MTEVARKRQKTGSFVKKDGAAHKVVVVCQTHQPYVIHRPDFLPLGGTSSKSFTALTLGNLGRSFVDGFGHSFDMFPCREAVRSPEYGTIIGRMAGSFTRVGDSLRIAMEKQANEQKQRQQKESEAR